MNVLKYRRWLAGLVALLACGGCDPPPITWTRIGTRTGAAPAAAGPPVHNAALATPAHPSQLRSAP